MTDPRITIAQNLTEIVDLDERLEDQAVNDANSQLMPGGLAMVALGAVANLEAWARKLDAAETRAIEYGDPWPATDEDDTWEPPLQTLLFWSEDLRRIHGQEFEPTPHRPRPTVSSEANIVRHHLDWLWENEPRFEDFESDVRTARKRMEELLSEGLRAKRGVPCLSLDCDGGVLVRPVAPPRDPHWCDGNEGVCTIPHKRCAHDRGGLRDEWICPVCDRRYGVDDYNRAVAQSAFLNAEWLAIEDVAARTAVKAGTIKVWATRGHVERRKDRDSGRMLYRVADVFARSEPEEDSA